MPKIKKGQIVHLYSSIWKKSFFSRISYISPNVDPNTRMIKCETEISNKNNLLRSGMSVSVTINYDKKYVFRVPPHSLVFDGAKSFVFTVDKENYAHNKRVHILSSHDRYSIISAEKKNNMTIVDLGVNGLYNWKKITEIKSTKKIENEK